MAFLALTIIIIINNFHNKLSVVFKEDIPSLSFLQDPNCCITVSIDTETVTEALEKLRSNKQDDSQTSSNYLLLAAPVLDKFLLIFFTIVIRHGYMPKLLRNCTLIAVPKPGKDPSRSDIIGVLLWPPI